MHTFTKLANDKWPFYDHFWAFFANCMDIFQKTEILTVILRCLVCPNVNLIKSYDILLLKIFFFMHHF